MCCIKLFVIPSHRVHSFTCTLPQSRVHACYRSAAHGKNAARGTPAPPQPPPHAPARSQALQPPRRIANLKPARNQVKRRNGEDQSRQTNRRMKRTLNGTWTREDAIDAHDARAQRAVQLHVLPLVQRAAALCRRDRIACTHRPILRSLRSELEREGAVGRDRRRVLSRDGAEVFTLPDVADGSAAADAKVGKVGGDVLSSVSACARRTPLVSKQTTWRSRLHASDETLLTVEEQRSLRSVVQRSLPHLPALVELRAAAPSLLRYHSLAHQRVLIDLRRR